VERELVLPADFDDYAWEVASKGVFWDVSVRLEGVEVAVTFYDPVRLSQDVADELAERSVLSLRRVRIVPSVTEEYMQHAIQRAPIEFFR
jgi:hypothetical protein